MGNDALKDRIALRNEMTSQEVAKVFAQLQTFRKELRESREDGSLENPLRFKYDKLDFAGKLTIFTIRYLPEYFPFDITRTFHFIDSTGVHIIVNLTPGSILDLLKRIKIKITSESNLAVSRMDQPEKTLPEVDSMTDQNRLKDWFVNVLGLLAENVTTDAVSEKWTFLIMRGL